MSVMYVTISQFSRSHFIFSPREGMLVFFLKINFLGFLAFFLKRRVREEGHTRIRCEKRRKEGREDVDKKIRELRTYLGLSQKNFGEAIGSTGTYNFQIEKQAANPSNQFIQKVCEGLRVNPCYFTDEMCQ